jgi:hypothetical protein
MTFSINQFRSEIQQNGYLKPHDYNLIISLPPILSGTSIFGSNDNSISSSNMSPLLSMRINECRSPLLTLISSDVNRYGIGPTQKMPHNVQFQDMWISIICDKYGMMWNFWHTWLNKVFSFSPPYNASTGSVNNGNASYTTEYKSNYSTNMTLTIYDQVAKTVLEFIMSMSFPIQMREVTLAWNLQNEIVLLNINLSYKDYTITGSSVSSTASSQNTTVSPPAVSVPSFTFI